MDVTRRNLADRVDAALGRAEADLVVKNARFLNLVTGELAAGDVAVADGVIVGTYDSYRGAREIDGRGLTVVPGLVDAHVHVESSLVTPFEFERCVLGRGTTTAICDPHEIANVTGLAGVRYFLACAEAMRMDLRIQLPSCVPATELETSGARLAVGDLEPLCAHPKVLGLAEVMNVPGVLAKDAGVLDKLVAFSGRPIDGHAPLRRGLELNAYLAAGVRTCHESTSAEEALEKLRKGMCVLAREGSVSRDVAALAPLFDEFTSPFLALCTDDRNPLDVAEEGHIDGLVRKAIARGAPAAAVYRAACWSAARLFGLDDRGLVAPGFRADLLLLDDLKECRVRTVIVGGRVVDADELAAALAPPPVGLDSMRLPPVAPEDLAVPAPGPSGPVIGVIPGQIITEHLTLALPWQNGARGPDPERDVQKVCVFARHGVNRNIGRGFVKGFGLVQGALASSVGHDSHNVIAVGVADADMALAVNRVRELGGGLVAAAGGRVLAELALPIAGLMSRDTHGEVCARLRALRRAARELGSPLAEPFLQLAFLPLPVIPHLKITDRGLVDVDAFRLLAA